MRTPSVLNSTIKDTILRVSSAIAERRVVRDSAIFPLIVRNIGGTDEQRLVPMRAAMLEEYTSSPCATAAGVYIRPRYAHPSQELIQWDASP